jgi:hypothetical protein
MEIKGRIFQILEPATGQSAKGEWKKQEFVIETIGEYPKKVCFTVWNDKFDISSITPDATIEVSFDAVSREYNGKWYTDLLAWKMELGAAGSADAAATPAPEEAPQPKEDGLPF